VRHRVKMPRLGDTTQSVMIAEWLSSVGDVVAIGAPLVLVETDKVTTEVPSPVGGTLVELLVAEQDEVEVGEAICVIEV
jgi:pyruvate/2-oxoglutarate dehydrogenase complex dihydrolipoamide acyltransferase (E2) component